MNTELVQLEGCLHGYLAPGLGEVEKNSQMSR